MGGSLLHPVRGTLSHDLLSLPTTLAFLCPRNPLFRLPQRLPFTTDAAATGAAPGIDVERRPSTGRRGSRAARWSSRREIVSLLTKCRRSTSRAWASTCTATRMARRDRARPPGHPAAPPRATRPPVGRARGQHSDAGWRDRRRRFTPRTGRDCDSRSSRRPPRWLTFSSEKSTSRSAPSSLPGSGPLAYAAAFRYADVGGRDALRKAAHWSFVTSALLSVVTALLGTVVASYRTF